MINGWTPGIGDPTAAGWITVGAYFIAAALTWQAGERHRADARWWRVICVVLTALGVNKQIDLQTLLTQIGREQAMLHHWYDQRRIFQRDFILVMIGVAAVLVPFFWWRTRRKTAGLRIAFAGLVVLTVFVIVRAASFHHMDVFLRSSWVGIRMNVMLELGGLGIVAMGAYVAIASARTTIRDMAMPRT